MPPSFVSAPWCRDRWKEGVDRIPIRSDLLDAGIAFARRSTTLCVWTVQGKLKGRGGREEFSVAFPVIGRSIWSKQIIPAIARRPAVLIQVLAGVVPPDIEEAFAEAGTALFPDVPTATSCTCCWYHPQWCKHTIAGVIQAAQLFVQDPFKLIEMRGIKRTDFLRLLHALYQKRLAEQGEDQQQQFALPTDPIAFWQGIPWTGSLPKLAEPTENFLWSLPQPTFTGGTSLANTFAYAYRAAREAGQRRS